MKASFAVTAYQETTRGGPSILECIADAVDHPLIYEIVIVDDKSSDFKNLVNLLKDIPKVKVFQNPNNLGVFGNKLSVISKCSYDWVINSDSDNIFDTKAINKVLNLNLDPMTWYCPSFAKPEFDYRQYIGSYNITNIKALLELGGLANCFVNTGNQTVNRLEFMKVFKQYLNQRADLNMPNYLNISERKRSDRYWQDVFNACDSLIFNYEWIKNNGTLEIVEGFEYFHFWTGGPDSNYNRAPKEKSLLNDLLLKNLKSIGS